MAKGKSAEELREQAEKLVEAAKRRAEALVKRAQKKEGAAKKQARTQDQTRKIRLARALTLAVRDGQVDLDTLRSWADPRVTRPADRQAIGLNPTFAAPNPKHRSLVWGGLIIQLLREDLLGVAVVQQWVDSYLGEKGRFVVEVPKEPEAVDTPELAKVSHG